MSRREGPAAGDQQQQRANSAQQTLDSELVVVVVLTVVVVGADVLSHAVLYDISRLLNTQLDKETLATCVGMIESGVNPEALAVSAWLCAARRGPR
jgi:mitotic-spindle organizing protein 1